jgi:hypothetical protein
VWLVLRAFLLQKYFRGTSKVATMIIDQMHT